MRTQTVLRSTLLATVLSAAVLTGVTPGTASAAGGRSADSIPTGAGTESAQPAGQKKVTPRYTSGQKAVEALGDKLDKSPVRAAWNPQT